MCEREGDRNTAILATLSQLSSSRVERAQAWLGMRQREEGMILGVGDADGRVGWGGPGATGSEHEGSRVGGGQRDGRGPGTYKHSSDPRAVSPQLPAVKRSQELISATSSNSVCRYRLGSFADIDTNADGLISREEFAAACNKVFNVELVPFVVDTVFRWVRSL